MSSLSLSLSNMNWDCLTTFFTHKYAETGIPIYYVLSAVHYISHTTHTCSSISTTKKSMQTRKCRGFRGVAITNSYEGASIVTKREVFLRRRFKCPHYFLKTVFLVSDNQGLTQWICCYVWGCFPGKLVILHLS